MVFIEDLLGMLQVEENGMFLGGYGDGYSEDNAWSSEEEEYYFN